MKPITYAAAGVDLARAERAKARIRALARRTFDRRVLADIGGFGSLFALRSGKARRWRDPVLVASCDGVGTKLKVAFLARRHNTVGADLVNHCVNDIAVQGAEPLFFLDYLAMGKLDPELVKKIVQGLAAACRENGVALVGGETAEMPGFYAQGEYDLAGFIVGVVERAEILTGARVRPGDLLVGLPSSGLHTNGYSLARRLLFEKAGLSVDSYVPELGSRLDTELLRVHRSYRRPLLELHRRGLLRAAAHITGGGFPGNLLRVLPRRAGAGLRLNSWPVPPIFRYLEKLGAVPPQEMYAAFNMGIGMVLMISPRKAGEALGLLDRLGENHYTIGKVVSGPHRVDYW